jgi:aspartate/methionine/tyrosine aminotransferase
MSHEPLFTDDQVDLPLLRRRAFNYNRWALLPEGALSFTAADPDFPVAREIREALTAYVQEGLFCYGPPEGLPEFRRAAARVMTERKGVPCPPERILALDSAASAMFAIARFALQPGDEALIFDPVDFLFRQSVEAAGGKVITSPADSRTGRFDLDALRQRITPRTRMLGVCNPHNPLGRVMTREELRAVGELAVEHGLWIMNDEVWSDIVYPPHTHVSIASISPEVAARTLTVQGFSKGFGLAGLRIGYVASPSPEVHEGVVQASRVRSTAAGASTLSQVAATAAYERALPWQQAFLAHLKEARDYAAERFNRMPGVKCRVPEGTFVLFPDVRELGRSSQELADYLLREARVALVPGVAEIFGPGAEGHLRLCFSTSLGLLREELDRIEAALARL